MALEKYKNKKVLLFFDDGKSISRKEGIVEDISDSTISFIEEGKPSSQLIPLNRVVRIEIVAGGTK